jgi:hypothetical protein
MALESHLSIRKSVFVPAGVTVLGWLVPVENRTKSGSWVDWPVSKSQGIMGLPLQKPADNLICFPLE